MTRRTRLFARTASALALSLSTAPALANGFESPSGNIVCYLDGYDRVAFEDMPLVCLIFQADWSLPPDYGDSDPTCNLDRTRTIVLPPDGQGYVRWSCHGDVFWPIPLGRISYGSQWTALGYTCDMARHGVSCSNGKGGAFKLSRAALAGQ